MKQEKLEFTKTFNFKCNSKIFVVSFDIQTQNFFLKTYIVMFKRFFHHKVQKQYDQFCFSQIWAAQLYSTIKPQMEAIVFGQTIFKGAVHSHVSF
jgi:hypothetical protein